MLALRNPHAVGKSNVEIAKHCGVSESSVRNIRGEMESTSQIAKSDTRTGADGRTINTENIGKRKPRVEREPDTLAVVEQPANETPETFDEPAPDDVPVFVVDAEPATVEPETPAAVVAVPPAPVRAKVQSSSLRPTRARHGVRAGSTHFDDTSTREQG